MNLEYDPIPLHQLMLALASDYKIWFCFLFLSTIASAAVAISMIFYKEGKHARGWRKW